MQDHPLLVEILNEVLGDDGSVNSDHHNFRCDDMMTVVRRPGFHSATSGTGSAPQPHAVPPGHGMRYRSGSGRINSGRARAVWELAGVPEMPDGGGATLLMPGSHKAEFAKPASINLAGTRSLMQSYSCPPVCPPELKVSTPAHTNYL